jgi:hypothetical protein
MAPNPVFREYLPLTPETTLAMFLMPKMDKMTNGGIMGEIYRIRILLLRKADAKNRPAKASSIFFSRLRT